MADSEFILLGDALWLDFANTAPFLPHRHDRLPDHAAYLRWTRALKLSAEGDVEIERVRRLRDQLVDLAQCLDAARTPSSALTQGINAILGGLEGTEKLIRVGGAWRLRFQTMRPPTPIEAIAASAASTLANPLAHVRRCAGIDCGLHFTDLTPQQGRRWCSPGRCGHRGRVERRRVSRATPLL
jgi:predicted RNA-binding Zn ribbon-like protein